MSEIKNLETFRYESAKPGDRVTADVVMEAMNCLPPTNMRLSCAQSGEPYSHRQDLNTGKYEPVYATFRCLVGGWNEGVWEYRGNCFRGETVERGEDPFYVICG